MYVSTQIHSTVMDLIRVQTNLKIITSSIKKKKKPIRFHVQRGNTPNKDKCIRIFKKQIHEAVNLGGAIAWWLLVRQGSLSRISPNGICGPAYLLFLNLYKHVSQTWRVYGPVLKRKKNAYNLHNVKLCLLQLCEYIKIKVKVSHARSSKRNLSSHHRL